MQYDFGTIDPFSASGVDLAGMLNSWRTAVYTMQRGAARPAFAVPGQLWVSDAGGAAAWVVNVYVSPAIGDKPLWTLDTTTGAITFAPGAIGGPYLPLTGGTLTGPLQATRSTVATAASPTALLRATGNGIDLKAWRSLVDAAGALVFQRLNEAESAVLQTLKFRPDGVAEGVTPAAVAFGIELATAAWVRSFFASSVGVAPQVDVLTAGVSYPKPANARWLRATIKGGGGAGGANAAGGAGNATTFAGVTANGGSGGGAFATGGGQGGQGGAGGTGGAGAASERRPGAPGGSGGPTGDAGAASTGGSGGGSGGGVGGLTLATVGNAAANSGGGGGGYGDLFNSGGGGGGEGETAVLIIPGPLAANYAYAIGASKANANAGTGAAGRVVVEAFF